MSLDAKAEKEKGLRRAHIPEDKLKLPEGNWTGERNLKSGFKISELPKKAQFCFLFQECQYTFAG